MEEVGKEVGMEATAGTEAMGDQNTATEVPADGAQGVEASEKKPVEEETKTETGAAEEEKKQEETKEPGVDEREKALSDREKAVEDREKAMLQKELEAEAKNLLKEKEIPNAEKLFPYLVRADSEQTKKAVEEFGAAFADALEAKLGSVMTGKTPKGTSGNVTGGDKTDADVFSAALRG